MPLLAQRRGPALGAFLDPLTGASSRPAWRPGRATAAATPMRRSTARVARASAGAASRTTSITIWPTRGILEIERQVVVRAAPLDQFAERWDVARQRCSVQLADRPITSEGPLDHTVVIEHRDAVGGDPDVALEAGCAQLQGQCERSPRCSRGRTPERRDGRTRWARRGAMGAVAAPSNDATVRLPIRRSSS